MSARTLLLAALTASWAPVGCGGGGVGTSGADAENDADGDGFDRDGEDCDDSDADINPDAAELCNGVDDDCDGAIDTFDDDLQDGITAYRDGDGDGYGDPESSTVACELGDGDVDDATDCNDSDPAAYPGATERCDTAADDDCDGETNDPGAEGCIELYADSDGDGFGGSESACLCQATDDWPAYAEQDCDDSAAEVNPDAIEVCQDGVDNNCDGAATPCELAGTIELGTADWSIWGESPADAAGTALVAPGELTGDGLDELVLLAPGAGDGGTVALFDGGQSGRDSLSDARAQLVGESGAPLAHLAAGDFNGDGAGDLAVGAPAASGGDGAVWLWTDLSEASGTRSPTDLAVSITGGSGDEIGLVGSGGDLDGDGDDELLVGAPGEAGLRLIRGPVSSGGDLSSLGQSLSGSGISLSAMSGVGDLDGDGLPDMAVGAEDRGGSGRVWVLSGPVTGISDLDDGAAVLDGQNTDDRLGAALTGVGDVTGDGLDDLLLGAPGVDLDSRNLGVAYLLAGPVTGSEIITDIAHASFNGEYSNDYVGSAVDGGEDVNNDGHPDLLIAAPGSDEIGRDGGLVYLVYGAASLTGTVELKFTDAFLRGRVRLDEAGTDAVLAGDINGDGFGDIAVGAPGAEEGSDEQGVVDVLFGSGL